MKTLTVIDKLAKPLVVISIVLYLLEEELSLHFGWKNSLDAPWIFLWGERAIALLFTIEIGIRWWRAGMGRVKAKDGKNPSYPFNVWGFIDVISVLPFWAGFFVPKYMLGVVRAMRILRLLKFFRYSRNLQLTFIKFYKAYHNIKGVAFSIGIIWLFFAVVCLKLEQEAQPEKFGSMLDAAWFTIVTGTTVGYGDASPVTTPGKIFVGLMLVPIIATIGASIAAVNQAFDKVQEMEDDPNIDPIRVFQDERARVRRLKQMDRDYQMEE